ncbi:hypothetical protein Rhe02_55090 [Rhizocola hellebori]|uniref:Uncharacterized protein n=1 Tax=Rhizocola hellebori TaxID=1392758 RepID=A0A8J3QCF0_9ACTN|nr:hypothetical protein [Rhizocola hellebori]GIH07442.1 hypothetical protein Rhe02_55090 [Rhizocola hellebori]
MDEDEALAMVDEWTSDPLNRVLDGLFNHGMGSQAEDFVHPETGEVGRIDEDTYIRYKTRVIRQAREEIEQLMGGADCG